MLNQRGFRVKVYVEIEKEKTVGDIPVNHMSLEDIMRLEDECTVTLGVPTGVLGPGPAAVRSKSRAAGRGIRASGRRFRAHKRSASRRSARRARRR